MIKPIYYDKPRKDATHRVLLYNFRCELDVGQDVDDQTLARLSYLCKHATELGRTVPEPRRGINHYSVDVEYEDVPSPQITSQRLKRLVRECSGVWKRFGIEATLIHKEWQPIGEKWRIDYYGQNK